eukprot:227098-Amphidinium_carterae.2
MKELTDISPQTTVSTDVQAQLLLRFSGLTPGQRSQVIAAAGNRMDMDSIEQGLRAQFAEYHLRQGGSGSQHSAAYSAAARPGGRSGGWNGKGGKHTPWSKGGGKGHRRATAYVAEEMGGQAPEEESYEWDGGDWGADPGAEVAADEGDSALLGENDQESLEAQAFAMQARKGKGKLKGQSHILLQALRPRKELCILRRMSLCQVFLREVPCFNDRENAMLQVTHLSLKVRYLCTPHPNTGRSISVPRTRPHPRSQTLEQLRPSEAVSRVRSRSPAMPRMLDDRHLSSLVSEIFLVSDVYVSERFVHSMKNVRKPSNEIDFFSLSPGDKQQFVQAMTKEWQNWLQFQAVEILKRSELPQPLETIGTRIVTRWVHTDKNERARKGGTKLPLQAKSRLVVQGHQEKVWIRFYAPTASVLCFNLICHIVATRNWQLRFADASSAFLQTAGRLGRLLLLRLPSPPPPGVPTDCVLTELGWIPNCLEQAFFVLSAQDGSVEGVLLTHVDDLLFTGQGARFEESVKELASRIRLTFKDLPFVFCGKTISSESTSA